MNKFNENDKMMAEKISKTLHNLQVQYHINFNEEVDWLNGLSNRFSEKTTNHTEDAIYFWDV